MHICMNEVYALLALIQFLPHLPYYLYACVASIRSKFGEGHHD